ncbi:MAG: signal peptidase I [Chlorobiota bacterium]
MKIKDILFSIIVAICLVLFIKHFIVDIRMVSSDSMSPTLKKGELVIISKLAYDIFGFEYKQQLPNDIVTFNKNNELLVKRISYITHDDRIFVVGDNIENSNDSRSFGLISKEEIIGKAIIKVNISSIKLSFL